MYEGSSCPPILQNAGGVSMDEPKWAQYIHSPPNLQPNWPTFQFQYGSWEEFPTTPQTS